MRSFGRKVQHVPPLPNNGLWNICTWHFTQDKLKINWCESSCCCSIKDRPSTNQWLSFIKIPCSPMLIFPSLKNDEIKAFLSTLFKCPIKNLSKSHLVSWRKKIQDNPNTLFFDKLTVTSHFSYKSPVFFHISVSSLLCILTYLICLNNLVFLIGVKINNLC